jgi:hypothetical protein
MVVLLDMDLQTLCRSWVKDLRRPPRTGVHQVTHWNTVAGTFECGGAVNGRSQTEGDPTNHNYVYAES